MISEFIIGKLIIVLFIFWCAYEDFRCKSIDIRICIGLYLFSIIWYVYMACTGKKVDISSILLGILPGAIIIVLSIVTRSAIGSGDGFFFIGIGLLMGITNTIIIMFVTFMILALLSLILIVRASFNNIDIRKNSIAMIPFVIPIGVYMLFK